MNPRYARAHLSDQALLHSLASNNQRELTSTADLLADIAEVDERRLFLPAGYSSMRAYCVGALGRSEDAAAKRIHAARVARRFPSIFSAVAEGRLHLAGVCLLAPRLTEESATELLAAAERKTKSEIEHLLAERFPHSDVFTWVVPTPSPAEALAPAQVEGPATAPAPTQHAPGHVQSVNGVARVTPLSSQSYALQVTLDQATHEDLRYAQALLGHQVPSGELAQVLGAVLKIAIRQLEKQKFAVTTRPRASHRKSANPRHIPAHVRRAVLERDGGRCAFVSDDGHRCQADTNLEFDDITEVARGGNATVEGIRLLCRAHNQYAAERTFGAEFIRHKRIAAAEARAAARETREHAPAARQEQATEDEKDVIPYLRALKFSAAEARMAAERCAALPPEATLEERVRMALKCIRIRGTRVERPMSAMSSA